MELTGGGVAIDVRVVGRYLFVAEDHVCGALGDHHRRRVDVAVAHRRQDRSVNSVETFGSVHLHSVRVDDGHRIRSGTHLCRAARMQRGFGVATDPVEDLLVGLDLGTR